MKLLSTPWAVSVWLPPVIAAVAGLCILFIMLCMCIMMYGKQRKKAYLYFIAAGLFVIAYESYHLYSATSVSPRYDSSWIAVLESLAFLLINGAVYQLYRKSNPRFFWTFTALIVLLLVPPVLCVLLPSIPASWKDPGLLIFSHAHRLLIIVWGLLWIMPRIGQQGKYLISLLIYTLWVIADTWAQLTVPPTVIVHMQHLRVFYYLALFLILFQRIVELLQHIYRTSITDGLTGLFNRKYFGMRLKRYAEEGVRLAVIFCDIDNFKRLNDTEGHARADEVLKQVAEIITEETENIGIPGRYGGEELLAMIVDKKAKPGAVAERIRARVEAESIVTISVGYSVIKSGVTPDELVHQADTAMYHSKTTGKNKVTDYKTIR